MDKDFAKAFALVLREGEDAGDVVSFGRFFFFGEVADEVAAVRVAGSHAVEEEGVDIVVQSLVVKEEFREETEVPTPGALAAAVNLEERDAVVTVYLVTRRVQEGALEAVPCERSGRGEVAEAVFADVDHVFFGEGERVGTEVPGLELELSHLHS